MRDSEIIRLSLQGIKIMPCHREEPRGRKARRARTLWSRRERKRRTG